MTKANGSNNLSCQKSPIKFAFYVATTGAKEEEGFYFDTLKGCCVVEPNKHLV